MTSRAFTNAEKNDMASNSCRPTSCSEFRSHAEGFRVFSDLSESRPHSLQIPLFLFWSPRFEGICGNCLKIFCRTRRENQIHLLLASLMKSSWL